MIIDLILDRKDGDAYNPKTFYNECMEYSAIFGGIADEITRAMDFGSEQDVQKALCDYIDKNGYNPEIKDYINSKKWLVTEKMRKVAYYIDDLEFFKADMNLSAENFKEMFGNKESFKAIYTLFGHDNIPEEYTLTDCDGQKIPLDSLNGYQKGVVLNDCMAHFTGGKYHSNAAKPCGVVKIIKEEI